MASSRMTSGEKLRMVSDSNQLFLKLVKSLQEVEIISYHDSFPLTKFYLFSTLLNCKERPT